MRAPNDVLLTYLNIHLLLLRLAELSHSARISDLRRNYLRDNGTTSQNPTERPEFCRARANERASKRAYVCRVSDGNLKIAPGHTSVAGAALLRARNGISEGFSTRRLFLCWAQPRVLCLPRVKILTSLTRLSRRLLPLSSLPYRIPTPSLVLSQSTAVSPPISFRLI